MTILLKSHLFGTNLFYDIVPVMLCSHLIITGQKQGKNEAKTGQKVEGNFLPCFCYVFALFLPLFCPVFAPFLPCYYQV